MSRVALLAMVLPVAAAAEPLLTARAGVGVPELLTGAVTLHAIPHVDVDAGGGALGLGPGWWVRAGPRYQVTEWGDDAGEHGTLRICALVGFGWLDAVDGAVRGLNYAGAVDLTWWSGRLGFTVQATGGATYDPARTSRKMVPDLRLSVGLSL